MQNNDEGVEESSSEATLSPIFILYQRLEGIRGEKCGNPVSNFYYVPEVGGLGEEKKCGNPVSNFYYVPEVGGVGEEECGSSVSSQSTTTRFIFFFYGMLIISATDLLPHSFCSSSIFYIM